MLLLVVALSFDSCVWLHCRLTAFDGDRSVLDLLVD
jgi:hypothetical protein